MAEIAEAIEEDEEEEDEEVKSRFPSETGPRECRFCFEATFLVDSQRHRCCLPRSASTNKQREKPPCAVSHSQLGQRVATLSVS